MLKKEKDEKEDINSEDYDIVGFRKVIDYINHLQIPIICHNGLHDILHVRN